MQRDASVVTDGREDAVTNQAILIVVNALLSKQKGRHCDGPL
jgi:hypothetical protein